MQASRLKNVISYGLILFFAVVVARGTNAFAENLALGVFFRLVLLPGVVLMVLMVVVQNWERIWGQGWGIPRLSLHSGKSKVTFILLTALLVGLLMARYGESLNLVSLSALFFVMACYFGSLYFIIVGKDHYALAIFLLSMPALNFVEWDMGRRWELIKLPMGDIRLLIKGEYIFIASLFGVWAASRLVRGRFHLIGPRRYVPIALLLLYSLTSILLLTYSHNLEHALNRIGSILVFPLMLYIMMFETVDTEEKLHLMVYSAIAMVFIYIFLTFYMSHRHFGITFDLTRIAEYSGLIKYGTGSPSIRAIELALITPLLLALLINVRSVRYVLLIIGLIVFAGIGLLLSFHRGGMLAALAGAACMLRNRRVWLIAILALIITIVFWEPIYNFGLTRFHNIYSLDDLTLRNLSYSRYQGWIAGIGMMREQPILGVGLSNFGDLSHLFSSPYMHRPLYEEPYLVYMSDPHNMFLGIASELGLVGLGLLLWFLGDLLFDLVRGLIAVKGSRLESLGWGLFGVYVASIVIYSVGGGFWVAKSSLGHNVLYWTLFAIIGRLRWVGKRMSSGTITEE